MMKQIKPLSISEEMLGAYLEGNLPLEEARYVENLIGEDADLQAFVGDLTTLDMDNEVSVYDDYPDFDAAFELPATPMNLESIMETSITSMGCEPLDICAITLDVTDDTSTIINSDISDDNDMGISNICNNTNDEDFFIIE